MNRKNIFTRELFVLFYLLYFGAMFVCQIVDRQILHYFLLGVKYIYMPGMLFAAGYQLATLDQIYPEEECFRKQVLRKSLIWLAHYYLIGYTKEILLDHRDIFATNKDMLALLRFPKIATIFITLCILYALAAFLWKPLMKLEKRNLILSVSSIVGFLFTLLPTGIIGYGSVGIFTGADNYGVVPIFPYLMFILIGAYMAQKEELHFYEKSYILMSGVMLIMGGGLILLHQKVAALTIIGMLLSWIGIQILTILYPIYEVVDRCILGTGLNIWKKACQFYKKQQKNTFSRGLFYVIGYSILFLIITAFIFFPYLQQHRTLIWEADGLGQYVPKVYRFMEYFPSIIKDLLHGNLDFKQYDFRSGLGGTVAITYDPIYWLYLLFNPSQIEKVYSLMIVLRYFLAGLSFSAMVLFLGASHFSAYTTSFVYAYSGYAIYAGTKHGQFLTPMILLPLLVIAMEKLIRDKKWYLMSILAGLSLLCSYYFLWMNTIAIGIYFVLRILCTKEYRNFKTFFTRGLIITGSYILGTGMGIISIFTQFASYMGSSRTVGTTTANFLSMTPLFYRAEWISDTFISFISDSYTPGMWLKLGFAPIALLACVLIFTRKTKKEIKPLFMIGTLFCIFPIFGFIFSGFSSVNNRWCYIYICLVAFILAEMMDSMPKLTNTELRIMSTITLLYGGIIFFSTKYHNDKVFGAYGLLAATLVVLFLINQNKPSLSPILIKPLIFGITVLSIIFNANMFIAASSEKSSHLSVYPKFGTTEKIMTSTGLRYLDEVAEGADFYRATNLITGGDTRNSSMIMDYNDLSTFTSTLGSGIVDYNSAMGNCDWNIVSIYDYNARTITNGLASVKYLAVDSLRKATVPYGYHQVFEKKEKSGRVFSIYENDFALPLGYTYDNILSAEEAASYSCAEKQELTTMTAIVNADHDVDNSNLDQSKKLPLTAHKVPINDIEFKGVTVDEETGLLNVQAGSSITLHFDGEANAETYIGFDGDIYHNKDAAEHFIKTQIEAEGTSYEYKFRIDSYSTGQEEFLFNLGYHEDAIDTAKMTFKKEGQLSYDEICIYSQPMEHYAANINLLKENVLEDAKAEKNTVTGHISLDRDKMLCITLPYQAGWTAYVDGEKTTIQRINYQYMGLNLTAGEHEIVLHYQLNGIKYAFLITGGSIGLFLLIVIFNAVRKRFHK